MSLGINRVFLALLDENRNKVLTGIEGITGDAKDKTGIFTVDADSNLGDDNSYGATAFNLTGLSGTQTNIWGSNKLAEISQGKASPQGALTINALPPHIRARVLGMEKNALGGFKLGQTNHARVVVLVESAETFAIDKPLYVALYKTSATTEGMNMQTNNENEQRTQDSLTFKAMERGTEGYGAFYHSKYDNFDFDAMMNEVFLDAYKTTGSTATTK